MNTAQTAMFYVASLLLLLYSVYFASKKHFRLSGLIIVLSFVSFTLAQLHSPNFDTIIKTLTLEQYLCWLFGLLFLCAAIYFIHEKALAYGFAIAIIAVLMCFCGFSSVQSLLKSHMLWMVSDRLQAYGQKIDTFQDGVVQMRMDLTKQQNLLTTNQTILSEQVSNTVSKQAELTSEQLSISNRIMDLLSISNKLAIAEADLLQQQEKLTNVQSLVDALYGNSRIESFSVSDTNKVATYNPGGVLKVYVILKYVPVPNSIQGLVYSSHGQTPLLPEIKQMGNLIMIQFYSDNDLKNAQLNFKYIKDPRKTAICHKFTEITTNSVIIDGYIHLMN